MCEQAIYNYSDVIMGTMGSQITGVLIVYSTICSGADQRKHQSSASLAFVRGIHCTPVNSPHKGPVTRKMFLFDDIIMMTCLLCVLSCFVTFRVIMEICDFCPELSLKIIAFFQSLSVGTPKLFGCLTTSNIVPMSSTYWRKINFTAMQ